MWFNQLLNYMNQEWLDLHCLLMQYTGRVPHLTSVGHMLKINYEPMASFCFTVQGEWYPRFCETRQSDWHTRIIRGWWRQWCREFVESLQWLSRYFKLWLTWSDFSCFASKCSLAGLPCRFVRTPTHRRVFWWWLPYLYGESVSETPNQQKKKKGRCLTETTNSKNCPCRNWRRLQAVHVQLGVQVLTKTMLIACMCKAFKMSERHSATRNDTKHSIRLRNWREIFTIAFCSNYN